MTIPEIAARLRAALCNCVHADEGVSPAERRYFDAVQLKSTDEEVILPGCRYLIYLEDHRVPMFVVKQWGKRRAVIPERSANSWKKIWANLIQSGELLANANRIGRDSGTLHL
jgi:hypothetical protein